MKKWKLAVVRIPIIGPVILIGARARVAFSYYYRPLFILLKWLFTSNETTNYAYDLEDDNKRYLAATIADALNLDYSTILGYIAEVEADKELKRHIADVTQKSSLALLADADAPLGRRMGWYAFARALKPKVVVETGVDKGLGSCVLTAALMKNRDEGYIGEYFGTDINPEAGYLLSGKYAEFGKILYGDSVESLSRFDDHSIDLFINDSDHSDEYEAQEYKTVADKLTTNAIVLGDNAHVTSRLLDFSLKTGRRFMFFAEKPANHWYPGGGIGISIAKPDA